MSSKQQCYWQRRICGYAKTRNEVPDYRLRLRPTSVVVSTARIAGSIGGKRLGYGEGELGPLQAPSRTMASIALSGPFITSLTRWMVRLS
jgi:hypothetical protein